MNNSAIRVKLLNINFLNEESLFQKKLGQLSSHRINKVQKYHFLKDKKLSLGAGLALDCLLKQIGLNEKDMKYQIGKYGKLRFANYSNIHFNISHSGDYAICVIAPIEIGVDIEFLTDYQKKVAEQFCFSNEINFIENLPKEKRAAAFTRLWTLKESLLKNLGTGVGDKQSFPKFIPNNLPKLEEQIFSDYCFIEFEKDSYYVSICAKSADKLEVVYD